MTARPRRRIVGRFASYLPCLAFVALLPRPGNTQVVVDVHECQGCDSVAELMYAAQNEGQPGSIALVSSTTHPLSAYFGITVETVLLPPWYVPVDVTVATALTTSEVDVAKLDNELYARAADIPPFEVPSSIGDSIGSADYWDVEGFVLPFFQVVGAQQFSKWHFITSLNVFESVYYNVEDLRTGEVHSVFIEDTITMKFDDGSTVQLEFVGPQAAIPSGHIFKWAFGTERDANGEPYYPSGPPSIGGIGGDFPDIIATIVDSEADPTFDCAIQVTSTACDVSLYGVPCWNFRRQVAVPCDAQF